LNARASPFDSIHAIPRSIASEVFKDVSRYFDGDIALGTASRGFRERCISQRGETVLDSFIAKKLEVANFRETEYGCYLWKTQDHKVRISESAAKTHPESKLSFGDSFAEQVH